jgi:hypothetical protein
MAFEREVDPAETLRERAVAPLRELRREARAGLVAIGTLACPECDAPVAIAGGLSPAHRIGCPYCEHAAPLRDFLSLAAPSRPARVEVRVRR